MLVAVLVLLAVLVALALVAVAAIVLPHVTADRGRRVIVNLRSGPSLTGQLRSQWFGRIVLSDARLHEAGEARHLDGRAVAYKGNVEFVQVLPALDPDAARS